MEVIQSEFVSGRRGRNGTTDRKPRTEAGVDMFWEETKLLEKWIQLWFSLEYNPSIIFRCCRTFSSSGVFVTNMEIFTPYFYQLETTGLFFYLFSVVTLWISPLCAFMRCFGVFFSIKVVKDKTNLFCCWLCRFWIASLTLKNVTGIPSAEWRYG